MAKLRQKIASIVQDRITGASVCELADKYGVNISSISRALSREDAQAMLNAGMQDQIRLIPKANAKLVELMDCGERPVELGTLKLIYQNVGIAPTHAPSQILVKLTQVNNTVVLSPQLEQVLQQVDGIKQLPDDCQDIIDL